MFCPALTAWLYNGELGALGVLMTSRMRARYPTPQALSNSRFRRSSGHHRRDHFQPYAGEEHAIASARVGWPGGI
jgi:hypothetical protein